MQYQILIFATADFLAAYEIDAWGKADVISLDGSITMKYRGSDDLRRFSDYIKDSFNIERYDEIDLSVMVLNCGMDAVSVFCLTGLFSGVAGYEVLDIRRVLPLAATAMGRTRKEGTANFSLLDARYAVCTGEDLQTECRCLDDEAGEVIELRPEHFGFLFRFDAGKFTADDEPLRKAQAELQTVRSELISVRRDYDKQIAELSRKIAELKNSQRFLIRVPSLDRIQDQSGHPLMHYKIFLQPSITDKSHVKKDQMLGWVKGVWPNGILADSTPAAYMSVPADGWIFFLVEDMQSVNEGDAVAIISATDTREEALQWYRSLTHK